MNENALLPTPKNVILQKQNEIYIFDNQIIGVVLEDFYIEKDCFRRF